MSSQLNQEDIRVTNFQDDELGELALHATWEIEILTKAVIDQAKAIQDSHDSLWSEAFLMKGLLMRIKELNSVVMASIGDGDMPMTDIKRTVG